MTLWIDAMLSPALARRITAAFPDVDAHSLHALGLREAKDPAVISEARTQGAVVLTKDQDFADEARRRGSPAVIWVRTGNTATRELWPLLERELPLAFDAIRQGAPLVHLPSLDA